MNYINYLEKIRGFSFKTIEIYGKYAHTLDYYGLDYKKMLLDLPDYSSNTMRLIISSLISYYKFLNDDRWKELKLPKKVFNHQEYVTFDEYKEILASISQNTKTGRQKRLIVRLLFETGLRSVELLTIRKRDITDNYIKIYGKGKKKRIVRISKWLEDELNTYAQLKEDFLFEFGYKNLYKKITGLRNKKINPHMFRRGYAKYCFLQGINIYDISLSMGHSSIETTANYIKRESKDVEIFQIF